MEFTNAQQLYAELQRRQRQAMDRMRQEALNAMRAETSAYYDGSSPRIYRRTYMLLKSPRTSAPMTSGDIMSFDAYLDQKYRYPSIQYGHQRPSKAPTMTDVLNLTNYQTSANSSVGYLHPAIGRPHYWERANDRMRNIAQNTLGSFFPR